MFTMPVLLKDGYKAGHKFQYPADTTLIYSNMTPRSSRITGATGMIFFGMQYLLRHYLDVQFGVNFFELPKDEVVSNYKRRMDTYLGPDAIKVDHIADLHDLGYLPLRIKSLPEGAFAPFKVPTFTVRNTIPEFFWLTNMLETLYSCVLWGPSTSATTAFNYRKEFMRAAKKTGVDPAFTKWQGHDFSFRGMYGVEAACMSGAAHLLSFTGTDTIPAIDFLEMFYGADAEKELIGGSVPATEHSVMSMGSKSNEIGTLKHLITEVYPKGIVSIVSDTWDLWQVLTNYAFQLKPEIMARDGKVVFRPDSGDPVKILCGDPEARERPAKMGVFRLLYEVFGGKTNGAGYIEIDPHVGAIYGDSISPERQKEILARMAAMGFASSNIVLGIGSYTYQYATRDTYGQAMKATYGETVSGGPQDIYKDPVTDDGGKRSATGLLRVVSDNGVLRLDQKCTWDEESTGLLETVFEDGTLTSRQTLADIRAIVEAELEGQLVAEGI